MVKLSCVIYKNFEVVCIIQDGQCVVRDVRKSTDGENRFSEALKLFARAFSMLRVYVESHTDEDEVIIETKNKTMEKWIKQGYSTDKYNEEFYEVLTELNKIPIKYVISYNDDLIAKRFADSKYLNKTALEELSTEQETGESIEEEQSVEIKIKTECIQSYDLSSAEDLFK